MEITLDGHTARILIQTTRSNALTVTDLQALVSAVRRFEQDPEMRSLVISGTGRSFCSGLSTRALLDTASAQDVKAVFDALEEALCTLFFCSKPIIAAVNGHAIGGGLLLQLCADTVIAAANPKIKFGLPEMALGLAISPAINELLAFNNLEGRRLSRILYSGELFASQQAEALGLIDRVAPEETLMAIATEAASAPGGNPAFSLNKQIVREQTAQRMRELMSRRDNDAIFALLQRPEAQERLRVVCE